MNTNQKGYIAESRAFLRAMELGYSVYRPVINARCDLILQDSNGKLIKVQVKYGNGISSNSEGSAVVKLAYEDRRKNVFPYRENEVDVLVVYLPIIDKLCLLPQKLFIGKIKLAIRYKEAKSKQKKGIIYAHDYYW